MIGSRVPGAAPSRAGRPDVLLVGDSANIHVRRLAAGLAGEGLTVELAGFEGDPIDGVVLHRLSTRPPAEDRRYPLAIPRLARLIRRRSPRLVHALFVSSYGLMAVLAVELAGAVGRRPPIVLSALGSDLLVAPGRSRLKRRLATGAVGRVDLMTHNSASLREVIEAMAPNVRIHRFVWGPERWLLEAGRHPEPVVLSTRRMERDMRVDLVVRAWRRAREIAPEALDGWRLVVTNAGSQSAIVHAAAGDDPTIGFVGVLPYDDLQQRLLASRISIAAPTSDATSAALMDALATGQVPIVNAIPGTLEWVDPSIGEIVSRDPSVDELAAAIARAVGRQVDPSMIRRRVAGIVWEDELPRLVVAYRSLAPDLAS